MSGGYVPITELADYLSVKVTTVRSWVQKGYIPKTCFIKLGNTYRFSIVDTVAALTRPPKEEPKELADLPTYEATQEPKLENPQLSFDFDEDDDI